MDRHPMRPAHIHIMVRRRTLEFSPAEHCMALRIARKELTGSAAGHTRRLQGLHHATLPQGRPLARDRHRLRRQGRPRLRLQAPRRRPQGRVRARVQHRAGAQGLQGQDVRPGPASIAAERRTGVGEETEERGGILRSKDSQRYQAFHDGEQHIHIYTHVKYYHMFLNPTPNATYLSRYLVYIVPVPMATVAPQPPTLEMLVSTRNSDPLRIVMIKSSQTSYLSPATSLIGKGPSFQ